MYKKNRREFLANAIALGTAAVLPITIDKKIEEQESTAELPSLKGRKVLFVYGGWPGHDPVKFKDYMMPWLQGEGAEVVASDKLDSYSDKTLMDSIDLIMQLFTMSTITNDQQKGLLT